MRWLFELIRKLFDKEEKKKPDEPTGQVDELPVPLAEVKWLYGDVSGWARTAHLSDVRIGNGSITLYYDKATVWPAHDFGDMVLNANPWVFALRDGKWCAATWEWLREGQITKGSAAVAGDHIKRREFNGWKPKSGEQLGFMVSGLIRGAERNVSERSNIIMVTWP